jgi:hypothetical protein
MAPPRFEWRPPVDPRLHFAVKRLLALDERHSVWGVPVLGLCWSVATCVAGREVWETAGLSPFFAFITFIGGGMVTIVAFWLGVGAVLWSMGRLLGGVASFAQVLKAFSRACPPLWVGAPGVAFLAAGGAAGAVGLLAALAAALGCTVFLASLAAELRLLNGWSLGRAAGSILLTVVFTGSVVFLGV